MVYRPSRVLLNIGAKNDKEINDNINNIRHHKKMTPVAVMAARSFAENGGYAIKINRNGISVCVRLHIGVITVTRTSA